MSTTGYAGKVGAGVDAGARHRRMSQNVASYEEL